MAGISQSSCSATDQVCICTNQELAATITACVAMNCTIKEQLSKFSIVACLDCLVLTSQSDQKCVYDILWCSYTRQKKPHFRIWSRRRCCCPRLLLRSYLREDRGAYSITGLGRPEHYHCNGEQPQMTLGIRR